MQSDTATKKRLLFYCIKTFHPSIRVRILRLSFLIIEIPPSPHRVLYNCEHPSFAVRSLADSLRIWRCENRNRKRKRVSERKRPRESKRKENKRENQMRSHWISAYFPRVVWLLLNKAHSVGKLQQLGENANDCRMRHLLLPVSRLSLDVCVCVSTRIRWIE